MSWIDDLIVMYSDSEAPSQFFYWAAASTISAVVRKNVWLNCQLYKLYPNIYTMIVADSGTKKGIPVNVAKQLVNKLNATRIVSGRNSMPQIIKDLSKLHVIDQTKTIKEAHAFLVTGELSSFLVKDPDALTILTDLYNVHEHEVEWKNSLKGSGVDTLKAPCLTVLGASNEDLLETVVGMKEVSGGFIARTFIVGAEIGDRGKPNSLLRTLTNVPNLDKLADYLTKLVKLNGEFMVSPDGIDFYEKWYNDLYHSNMVDKTHTRGRMGDRVLKLAMIESLANKPDLIITKDHIYRAIHEAERAWKFARQIMLGGGKDLNLAAKLKIVFRLLILHPNHQMTRKAILQRSMGELDHFDLDHIIENLLAADAITVEFPNTGRAVYTLKDHAVKMFDNTIRSIN